MIPDEIRDINPRSWLCRYRKNSTPYLFKMGLFYLGFGIILQQITNLVLLFSIPNYHVPSVPISIIMGLTSAPLEEVTFFGVPYYLTGSPVIILSGGIIWSILHVFNTLSFSLSDLAYGTLFLTIPHIFFSLRTWLSGKGWFAIVFHFAWNTLVLALGCSTNGTCILIGSGWYFVLDLLSVAATIVLSIMLYRANSHKIKSQGQ